MSKKVPRPATPNLDLLQRLFADVYWPVARAKLASHGIMIESPEEMIRVLGIGSRVADDIEHQGGKLLAGDEEEGELRDARAAFADRVLRTIRQDPELAAVFERVLDAIADKG